MNRIDYDTRQGIQEHLGSLEDLHVMLDARRADESGGSLERWTLLGRFSLSEYGNVGRYRADGFRSYVPAEANPLIHDVVPEDDVYSLVASALHKPRDEVSLTTNSLGNPNIPSSHVRCTECHTGWTVRTAHDAEGIFDRVNMDLRGFEGKTANEVNEALGAKKDREGERWLLPAEWFVKTPGVVDEEGRDWRRVREDYVIQAGDEAKVNRQRFVHPTCQQERVDREAREDFEAMIEEAGFEEYEIEAVANQYGSGDYRGSWFRVNTSSGKPLLVGWRKRVIDIQWSPEDFRGDITNGDEVTKSAHNAHAWTRGDAVRYLGNLKNGLGAPTSVRR